MFAFRPVSPRIEVLRNKRARARTYMDAERTKITRTTTSSMRQSPWM